MKEEETSSDLKVLNLYTRPFLLTFIVNFLVFWLIPLISFTIPSLDHHLVRCYNSMFSNTKNNIIFYKIYLY